MEHKLVDKTWQSPSELEDIIRAHQVEGWCVGAMGNIQGSEIIVMTKMNDTPANHEVIPIDVTSAADLKLKIAEKIAEGYEICAIGECSGIPILIARK